jgi:hypothetical protein
VEEGASYLEEAFMEAMLELDERAHLVCRGASLEAWHSL